MKHFCGGSVAWRREESFFYCQRCPARFSSIEEVLEDNRIAEQSDEQYEYKEEEMEVKK